MAKKMAREVLIDFIKANHGEVTFGDIENHLSGHPCMKSGVKPIDVVNAAMRDGFIYYSQETGIVRLRRSK